MNDKILKLIDFFDGKTVAVAFSGGTDSAALLHILKRYASAKITAFTFHGAHIPAKEFARAKNFCKKFNVNHKIIPVDIFKIENLENSDRCYFCKKNIFEILKQEAKKIGAQIICDGTNIDDKNDYRPGMKALAELEIFSPFLEFKIGKKEIFDYLAKQNLNELAEPSNACLLSRIGYGLNFSEKLLKQIDDFENYLRALGFKQVRARIHSDILRIEIEKKDFPRFFEKIDEINKRAEHVGKKHVALDLNGYRTGSMNE